MRAAAAAARAMLLSAAAKDWGVEVADLTVENGEVAHAGSSCRAPYAAFIAAAQREAVPENPPLKPNAAFRLIGNAKVQRLDVPAKTNGSAIYTQDVRLPGMLVAVMAHPPRLWGKVARLDAGKALAVPGVKAVIEVPGDDEVQGGVAMLAANTWVAAKGRDALEIEWDDTKALSLGSEQIRQKFHALLDTPGVVAEERGKVLTSAPAGGKYFEATYDQPYLAHAPMEPMNCVVHARADACEIWNGEQWHTGDQASVAKELGLKPEQVTLRQLYAGGSFGRRANPRSDFVREAARVAREAGKQGVAVPIKMVWMREDDMKGVQYRPLTVQKVAIAVDEAGRLTSWRHMVVGQSFMNQPAGKVDDSLVEGLADMPYVIPNVRVEHHNPDDVAVPVQWMRSVGHTHTAFVGETMIDAAARLAGKDPYEFRRAMLPEGSRDRGVLELVADKAGWDKPLAPGKAGEKRGRGVALRQAFHTYVAQVAEVTAREDGSFSVDRIVCAVDCGVVVNPDVIETQVQGGIAFGLSFLRQQITIENGHVVQGNFNDYPVVRMNGMPPVEVHTVASSQSPTVIGEPGVPPTAPAVVNAIVAATGVSIYSLPLVNKLRLS